MFIGKRIWMITTLMVLGAFLACFVSVPGAEAASAYSVPAIAMTRSGSSFTVPVIIEISDAASLNSGDTLNISLSSGYYGAVIENYNMVSGQSYDLGSTCFPEVQGGNAIAAGQIRPAGPGVSGSYNGMPVTGFTNWDLTLTANSTGPGKVQIPITVVVPMGRQGDKINLVFSTSANSGFSNGQMQIAEVGPGKLVLGIANTTDISGRGGAIGNITVSEQFVGDLKYFSLKLPPGFRWMMPPFVSVPGGPVPPGLQAIISPDARIIDVLYNPPFSPVPLTFTLSNCFIAIDSSVAKEGDVYITVSGDIITDQTTLKIGTYTKPADVVNNNIIAYTLNENLPDVIAGRNEQRTASLIIEEKAANSLAWGKTITMKLLGGASWLDYLGTFQGPVVDYDKSTVGTPPWSIDSTGTVVTTNLPLTGPGGNTLNKIVFKPFNIKVLPDASGPIEVLLGGSAGVSGQITVANAAAPVAAGTDGNPANLVLGAQAQELPPIIITEDQAETLINNRPIILLFPGGVTPGKPSQVEVTAGDLVLDAVQMADNAIIIPVRYSSTQASSVKISGIKISCNASVPEGDVAVRIGGEAVFPTEAPINSPPAWINLTVGVARAKVAVTGIALDRKLLMLTTESTPVRLQAELSPVNHSNSRVTWTSSNPEIASVTDGLVTPLKEGSTIITAKAEDGGFTAECQVVVRQAGSNEEFPYTVVTNFSVGAATNATELRANKLLVANANITNNQSIEEDVILLVALYDNNNAMVNLAFVSKKIPALGTENFRAGFKLPSVVAGYQTRAWVWQGTDIMTSPMVPVSNVTKITGVQ